MKKTEKAKTTKKAVAKKTVKKVVKPTPKKVAKKSVKKPTKPAPKAKKAKKEEGSRVVITVFVRYGECFGRAERKFFVSGKTSKATRQKFATLAAKKVFEKGFTL